MGKHSHKHRDRSRSSSRHKHKHSKHKNDKKKKRVSRSRSRSRSYDDVRASRAKQQSYEDMLLHKKRMKEIAKSKETPEEKLKRRSEKKMNKDRNRRNKGGWDEEYLGYTNLDNPFGDDKLLQTFMWNKKLQKEGKGEITRSDFEKEYKSKMVMNKIELEKVKKRRIEREKEREDYENDKEMMQRSKECEYFKTWEKQEDKFHLDQAKLRSNIRINDGRAKPIDLLAYYIRADKDNDTSLDLHEPYTYLDGLSVSDLEDLKADICVYQELDNSSGYNNNEYWNDISTIATHDILRLRTRDDVGERRQAINASVRDDVKSIFEGKTIAQLEKLHSSIQMKLRSPENIDISYWESLIGELSAHIAKSRLKRVHESILRAKLSRLKEEQGVKSKLAAAAAAKASTSTSVSAMVQADSASDESGASGASGGEETSIQDMENYYAKCRKEEAEAKEQGEPEIEEFIKRGYEPKLFDESELPVGIIIVELNDDEQRLAHSRDDVVNHGIVVKQSDDQLIKKAMDGMSNEEVQFSVELPLMHQSMMWSDKYRPRKPRFFNRVHTGFEWNKYNQTHYDVDNPPPKIVQGYKFNIFYPDLIDKSTAPEFSLTILKNEPEFACLKFTAGPPYEAIAFKVVHREWECGYKRGFRCQFQNNVFQLWYHFKRYRYRR